MLRNKVKWNAVLLALLLLVGSVQSASALSGGPIQRVSVASDGTEADYYSSMPAISSDGRFVVFSSSASNLVPGGTNGEKHIFVHDRLTGTTELVSKASDSTQANSDCYEPVISGDGRYVAFYSNADNLVPDDTNNKWDVFVHDRQSGTTERVSVASDDSQSNRESYGPAISYDGRYVGFSSWASNLVDDDTNGWCDAFVHDRQTGTTERVSVSTTGAQATRNMYMDSISGDGRYVAMHGPASNLVSGDANGADDIFVRDRQEETTKIFSLGPFGLQANGDSKNARFSDDGRYLVFVSEATNLVSGDTNGNDDIFICDLQSGTIERITEAAGVDQAPNGTYSPAISSDGQFVVFVCYDALIPEDATSGEEADADLYLFDMAAGTLKLVSVLPDGTQGNGGASSPDVSDDGRYVAFVSSASNFVPADTNDYSDVFVKDRWTMLNLPLLLK